MPTLRSDWLGLESCWMVSCSTGLWRFCRFWTVPRLAPEVDRDRLRIWGEVWLLLSLLRGGAAVEEEDMMMMLMCFGRGGREK